MGSGQDGGPEHGVQRGRPPGTSNRALELAALELFTEQGFDETTVEQIASHAGVSRRTFFRYFDSKTAVLWHEFDDEVAELREALAAIGDDIDLMTAISRAVVSVNRYRAEDVPELRKRMHLISVVPALQASAAAHYDAWERAISDYVGRRLGEPANALVPMVIGRATLAACRSAFDHWVTQSRADLTGYLREALHALATASRDYPTPV